MAHRVFLEWCFGTNVLPSWIHIGDLLHDKSKRQLEMIAASFCCSAYSGWYSIYVFHDVSAKFLFSSLCSSVKLTSYPQHYGIGHSPTKPSPRPTQCLSSILIFEYNSPIFSTFDSWYHLSLITSECFLSSDFFFSKCSTSQPFRGHRSLDHIFHKNCPHVKF